MTDRIPCPCGCGFTRAGDTGFPDWPRRNLPGRALDLIAITLLHAAVTVYDRLNKPHASTPLDVLRETR